MPPGKRQDRDAWLAVHSPCYGVDRLRFLQEPLGAQDRRA